MAKDTTASATEMAGTYLLTNGLGNTQTITASRIGVNESGALLIMAKNPVTNRHDPQRILAPGRWLEIERTDLNEK